MNNTVRKLLSLILTLCLCLCCLSGCGEKETSTESSDTEPTAETPDASDPASEGTSDEDDSVDEEMLARYTAVYSKYAPDDIVLYVNGEAITWADYYYWVFTMASQIEQNYAVTDWSEEIPELVGYIDDPSYGAYALSYAETNAIQSILIEQHANQLGASMTEEQRASIDDSINSYIEANGEDGFEEYLASNFISREYFVRQNGLSMLYSNLHNVLFGIDGENLSDEEAISFLDEQGFLHAKHILFKTVDDERNPLSEEEIAAKKAQAADVLSQLQAVSPDKLAETFDQLMNEYSEDPGSISYPSGYYFQAGEMVASFEMAAATLEENELSDLVESEYGIHILYHPVANADDVMDYDTYGQPYTPRAYAADALFTNMLYDWYDAAEIEYTPEFEGLKLADLMAD